MAVKKLAGLTETEHLLRSPKNAQRLLAALVRAERSVGTHSSVKSLRQRVRDYRKRP